MKEEKLISSQRKIKVLKTLISLKLKIYLKIKFKETNERNYNPTNHPKFFFE